MTEEFERKFIRPIINASNPGTLAALNPTALQVTGTETITVITILIALGSMLFIVSAFSIFFYTLYPTKGMLWTSTALSFLAGLTCSLVAVFAILMP